MDIFREALGRLKDDTDVAEILEVFQEIEDIYSDSLKAMGITGEQITSTVNTSEVTISFPHISYTLDP